MPRELSATLNRLFSRIGRYFLRRLEIPLPTYKQRIINNMVNLYRVIQPEDVLLVEGRSKISQIIQLLTKSSWSHAAIYVGDYLKESKDPKVQNRRDRCPLAKV